MTTFWLRNAPSQNCLYTTGLKPIGEFGGYWSSCHLILSL